MHHLFRLGCSSGATKGTNRVIQPRGWVRYTNMERFPVSSTSLRSIGYDVKKKVLEVEFLSGRIYRYFGVPGVLLLKMLAAKSIGWFFNRHVRERFDYAEV